MEELGIMMIDFKAKFDEIYDGRDSKDIPREEFADYLENILELFCRFVDILRIHDYKIKTSERLIKGMDLDNINNKIIEMFSKTDEDIIENETTATTTIYT